MTAAYEDQWLRVRCTECDGLFGDEAPAGTVYLASYPAAGVRDRSAGETLETGLYRCILDNAYMMHGVCRECAGGVSAAVSVCEDHTGDEGACPTCGTPFPVWAEQRCDVCGFAKRLPVETFVVGLTPVVGFLDEHGFDALAPSFAELVELLRTSVETTVVEDPFRVAVTVGGDGERLRVSLDEGMNVVDVDRRPGD
jgi:hypothetical protein